MDGRSYSVSEVARASGLPVSALRFYSGNGVLIPAFVDQRTGYRWYTDEQVEAARLLALLRAARLSLAEIKLILSAEGSTVGPGRILDSHVDRLAADFEAARKAAEDARIALGRCVEAPNKTMRFVVKCTELVAAFEAIRFAVSVDSAIPALRHVLVELRKGRLTLVSTDRHRLALGRVAARGGGDFNARMLVPVCALKDSVQKLRGERTVPVELSDKHLRLPHSKVELLQPDLADQFPDFRSLMPPRPRLRVRTGSDRLRGELETAPARRIVRCHDGKVTYVCTLDFRRGELCATRPSTVIGHGDLRLGVDRTYMLQALDALNCAELEIGADDAVSPIVIRPADDNRVGSLLMPVHL